MPKNRRRTRRTRRRLNSILNDQEIINLNRLILS